MASSYDNDMREDYGGGMLEPNKLVRRVVQSPFKAKALIDVLNGHIRRQGK